MRLLPASIRLFVASLCLLLSWPAFASESSTQIAAAEDAAQAQLREAAVERARRGEFGQALSTLRDLHQSDPRNAALTADLLTVLVWADRHREAVDVSAGLDPGQAPAWAYLPWARALRNLGRYEESLAVLTAARTAWPADADERQREPLLRALVLADAGRLQDAQATLTSVRAMTPADGTMSLETELAAAYIYRRDGQPGRSLQAARHVLQQQPENVEAWQHQVFALLELGAASRALALAEARAAWFTNSEMAQLRLARAAQQLGWARLADAAPALDPDAGQEAAAAAVAVLQALLRELPESAPALLPAARREYLLALFQQHRYAEVTTLYSELIEDGEALPIAVRLAAADAWLRQQQPRRALALYRDILAEDPWYYEARVGMYWALFENDEQNEAGRLIDQLAAEKPPYLPAADGSAGARHWRKLELDLMAAMHRAMTNRPDLAQTRLESLSAQAPASAQIRRELATVYRWRGWSERALAESALAQAYEPDVISGRLLQIQLQQDIGAASADRRLQQLQRDHPDHRQVARAYRDLQNRRRWGMSTEAGYGDSDGFAGFGARDRSLFTRVHGPRLDQTWQLYGWHQYADASFPEGNARYERLGAGLDWRRGSHRAYLETHASYSGASDAGVTLGYDRRWNDHWSSALRYDSFSTAVPLRARNQGLDGWEVQGSARWRAHESRSVQAGLSQLSISDGNRRLGLHASADQRLFANARHITQLRADLHGSRASQPGGPYFNPQHDLALHLTLTHDWLTWRAYDRGLTQRFRFGAGGYWQQEFGSDPIAGLGYEHRWSLNARWRLNYGASYDIRVYDGDHERRASARLQLEGLF